MPYAVAVSSEDLDFVRLFKERHGMKTNIATMGTMFAFLKHNEFALNEYFKKPQEVH